MTTGTGGMALKLRKMLQRIRRTPFFQKLLPLIDYGSLRIQEVMLCDHIRMRNYKQGLSRNIGEGDVVVDLGSGSGILSFFAAQNKAAKVYGIEQETIIEKARMLAEHNGISTVEFVKTNSSNFSMDGKADVIIHEQMGFNLFDENMVPNLVDLRDRVLKEGGKILPGKFDLFVEPIMIKEKFSHPFIWELNIYGIDYSCLKAFEPQYKYSDRTINIRPTDVENFLCEPRPAYSCDLHTMKAEDLAGRLSYTRKVVNGGRLGGFMIYFDSHFDDENGFSTWAPEAKTHWGLTVLRVEGRDCSPGQEISLEFNIGDWANSETWSWDCRVS